MTTTKKRNRASTKLRRRISGALALGVALVAAGGLYTVFVPRPQTATAAPDQTLVREGKQLFTDSCISCHGNALQGVPDHGPTLIGVGGAAVDFQVSSGRMPLMAQGAEADTKPPKFTPQQISALDAYVESVGGGPQAITASDQALVGSDPAQGGQLFRLNCASCHNITGRGIAMASGTYAPNISSATEKQVYEAMLTGPENMPKFSDRQLTPTEKKDIIAYVKSVTSDNNNPGGNDLGGYGPGPETVIAWVIGLGSLIGLTLWIGAKA